MTRHVARAGLFAYAASLVVEVVLSAWSRHLIAVMNEQDGGFSRIEKQLDLIGYGYTALGVGAVVALLAAARAPREALMSRTAMLAAIAAGLAVVLELAQRVFIATAASASVARLEGALRVFGVGLVLSDTVAKALVVVLALRVGRVAASRATTLVADGAFVALGVGLAANIVSRALGGDVGTLTALAPVETAAYYGGTVLVATAAILAGRSLPQHVAQAPASERGAPPEVLSPQWRSAVDGIGLYLGGAAARVVCAFLGYAAMAASGGGTTAPDLHAMHDSVFVVALLSGAAGLTMLTGVWRITRAPPESGGVGPAMVTLCLMILGLVLDLVITSITLDALGGSLSAAFFAMDAIPLLAAGAAILGVGAGVALLTSLGNMSRALGAVELRSRAKSATVLLVVGGAGAGLAFLGLKHMPVEVLGLVAVIVLPVAIAAVVQFLRVAVPLRRRINGAVFQAS
jgi:hypothetical protein